MEIQVKKKCEVTNSCLFCIYHTKGEGKILSCAEYEDIDSDGNLDENFDYESEKDCCDLEFWKVLDVDVKMQELFSRDMTKNISSHQEVWDAYKYFSKNY